jgi:hypothetical protein
VKQMHLFELVFHCPRAARTATSWGGVALSWSRGLRHASNASAQEEVDQLTRVVRAMVRD